MIKEAIEKIESLTVEAKSIDLEEIHGRTYTTSSIKPVDPPTTEALSIRSLTGIGDYIQTQFSHTEFEKLMIHVYSHRNVNLYGPPDLITKKRPCYIQAEAQYPDFRYGDFLDLERFIISLQSKFVADENQQIVLKYVSSLCSAQAAEFEDDGVTQVAMVKKGITQREQASVPSPIALTPYRSFSEIKPVSSNFIMRLKPQKEASPLCALYEADGGAWIKETMDRISEWLHNSIQGVSIIS